MVDESIKQYLLTKTGINENKITELLSYSIEDGQVLKEDENENVIQALHEVKIIDPACGSGAFPIGILQKILLVLQSSILILKSGLQKCWKKYLIHLYAKN